MKIMSTRLINIFIVVAFGICWLFSISTLLHHIRITSPTWDEASYTTAAAHIAGSWSLDVNHEVPPLAKIYMALWTPKSVRPYLVPTSEDRTSHALFPARFFGGIPDDVRAELIENYRLAQVVLYQILIVLVLLTSRSVLREYDWRLRLLPPTFVMLWPSLIAWGTIATTDVMAAIALTLGLWSCWTRRHGFWIGSAFAIGLLSKGTFFAFVPALTLAFLFAHENWKVALRQCAFIVLGCIVTLHILTFWDQMLWTTHPPDHRTYSFVITQFDLQKPFTQLVYRLTQFRLLPEIMGPIALFNASLSQGAHPAFILGEMKPSQTFFDAVFFLAARSSPVELASFVSFLFAAAFGGFFLVVRLIPRFREKIKSTFATRVLAIASLFFFGVFMAMGVKFAMRYALPFFFLGSWVLSFALARASRSHRKPALVILGVFIAVILTFQASYIHRNRDDLVLVVAPWIEHFGGLKANPAVYEDIGQEDDRTRAELTKDKNPVWYSSNLTEWRRDTLPPLFPVNCKPGETFTVGYNLITELTYTYPLQMYSTLKPIAEREFGKTGRLRTYGCEDVLNDVAFFKSLSKADPPTSIRFTRTREDQPDPVLLAKCIGQNIGFPEVYVQEPGQTEKKTPGEWYLHLIRTTYGTSTAHDQDEPTKMILMQLPKHTTRVEFPGAHCRGRFY